MDEDSQGAARHVRHCTEDLLTQWVRDMTARRLSARTINERVRVVRYVDRTLGPAHALTEEQLRDFLMLYSRVSIAKHTGSRMRGFGSLRHERLFLKEINNILVFVTHVENYRIEYNSIRSHGVIVWNWPFDVHVGYADLLIQTC